MAAFRVCLWGGGGAGGVWGGVEVGEGRGVCANTAALPWLAESRCA